MSDQSVGPAPLDSKSEGKKEKVCDFYLTPRGCIKGDKCDFQHPLAPGGAPASKVCDFYLTPRGCRKGESCDFLHPQPKQPVKNKVCTFYMTPQGCIKGLNCDFLHPRPGVYGDPFGVGAVGLPGFGGLAGGDPSAAAAAGGDASAGASNAATAKHNKPCDYYLTARGCVKGDSCDFLHVPNQAAAAASSQAMAGMPAADGSWQGYPFEAWAALYPELAMQYQQMVALGAFPPAVPAVSAGAGAAKRKKPKLCEFFKTPRGCVKGDTCDFIHQKDKVCDFFLKPGGCRKGDLCDYQHPKDGSEASLAAAAEGDGGKIKTKRTTSRFEPY